MNNRIRVRYAPSPTGYQHIGGIRTALFNYLFAKANNGDFILRIEDTDRTRFFDGALEDIFKTFEWLGIEYDEGPKKDAAHTPYFQSKRKKLYEKYAQELIDKDCAYYCFCDSERLKEIRLNQTKNNLPTSYDRHCRNIPKEKIEEYKKAGKKAVIRLKVPPEGTTFFYDVLFDKIEVENSNLQDFILLKSDGFPTYHLANVIDDHLMKISHVLRAQEWIPSTPNHLLLYNAFGWTPPKFCHLPMVMGEDKQKLSKRHGATHVKEFKKNGYLPEAIINFVVLLGWAYNDSEEMFTMNKLKKVFGLKKINKSPAIFNYDKLKWFNGIYIRKMNVETLSKMVLPYYIEKKLISKNPANEELNYLNKIIPLIQERIDLLTEAPEKSDFMFNDLPPYKTWEAIIPKKTEKTTVSKILKDAKEILQSLGKDPNENLQHKLYDLSKKHNVKAGAVFMPIRIAITGTNKSPELFPVMEVLGRDRVSKRIDAAINKLKG